MMHRGKRHPMQPIELVNGVIRFRQNPIVCTLLDTSAMWDLNSISRAVQQGQFSRRDYAQLIQLTGRSVSGFGEIGIVPRSDVDTVNAKAKLVLAKLEKP